MTPRSNSVAARDACPSCTQLRCPPRYLLSKRFCVYYFPAEVVVRTRMNRFCLVPRPQFCEVASEGRESGSRLTRVYSVVFLLFGPSAGRWKRKRQCFSEFTDWHEEGHNSRRISGTFVGGYFCFGNFLG